MPVGKSVGDDVFAGTLNGAGTLRIRVTKDPSDSVVARIVAQASATKATAQLFIDKVEQRYSVGVIVATVALFAVPLMVDAASGDDVHDRGLAVRGGAGDHVAAAVGDRQRRTHSVLVKSAVAMEHLADRTQVTFD